MMKKLLFCFLAAALVLTSCSKDDSLPLPEVSKVEIIGATEGQMKITTGQTVGFSVECENVAIDRYEWIVNEKIESESVRFDFTPAQRGTYDISVNLYNATYGRSTATRSRPLPARRWTFRSPTGADRWPLPFRPSIWTGSRRKTRRLRSISTVPTRTGYGYSARLPADWAFSIRAARERSTRITCIRPSTAKVRAARTESTT